MPLRLRDELAPVDSGLAGPPPVLLGGRWRGESPSSLPAPAVPEPQAQAEAFWSGASTLSTGFRELFFGWTGGRRAGKRIGPEGRREPPLASGPKPQMHRQSTDPLVVGQLPLHFFGRPPGGRSPRGDNPNHPTRRVRATLPGNPGRLCVWSGPPAASCPAVWCRRGSPGKPVPAGGVGRRGSDLPGRAADVKLNSGVRRLRSSRSRVLGVPARRRRRRGAEPAVRRRRVRHLVATSGAFR